VRDQSGQSLILMTIAMFLFIVIGAFALDVAQLGVAHHQAQVAADAAALSAAQDMETTSTPPSTVNNDGTTAAQTNDPKSTVTMSEPSGVQAKAQVTAPVSLPFGKVFGLGAGSVTATSVASVNIATTSIDGQILSINCVGDNTTPCEYGANAIVPTSSSGQTTGWEVTKKAEDPTTNGPGTGYTAGESTVNIQTCNGTTGNGSCFEPNSTSAVDSNNLTQVVDLNGDSEGGMWQTVATIPNATYVLTFWLTGNPALNGWPNAAGNNFPLDVWVTSGSGTSNQFTPSVTEGSTPSNVCNTVTDPSNYVACGWWDYQDQVCGASGVSLNCTGSSQEEADFTIESMSFTATSDESTITFNSEVYDNDAEDPNAPGDGWFNCGPEIAQITFGPPAIQLTQ
jgi:Flp pilus assembly protein TadG